MLAAHAPQLRKAKAARRAAYTRLLVTYERTLEARLAAWLKSTGERCAIAWATGGMDSVDRSLAVARVDLHTKLRTIMRQVARHFGHDLLHAPRSAGAVHTRRALFSDFDDAVDDWLADYTAKKVVRISDTTRETIRRTVARGVEDDEGQDAIARSIRDATSGTIGLARARVIARTETHTAAEVGQRKAAQASPLDYVKEWLATEDDRTRPDHADANGQRVALDKPFVIGGVEMDHPGDPDAPPGQTINCRCTCLYEPIEA